MDDHVRARLVCRYGGAVLKVQVGEDTGFSPGFARALRTRLASILLSGDASKARDLEGVWTKE